MEIVEDTFLSVSRAVGGLAAVSEISGARIISAGGRICGMSAHTDFGRRQIAKDLGQIRLDLAAIIKAASALEAAIASTEPAPRGPLYDALVDLADASKVRAAE